MKRELKAFYLIDIRSQLFVSRLIPMKRELKANGSFAVTPTGADGFQD